MPNVGTKSFGGLITFLKLDTTKQLPTFQLQFCGVQKQFKFKLLNDRSWSTFFFKISTDNFDPALKITRKTELSQKVFGRL